MLYIDPVISGVILSSERYINPENVVAGRCDAISHVVAGFGKRRGFALLNLWLTPIWDDTWQPDELVEPCAGVLSIGRSGLHIGTSIWLACLTEVDSGIYDVRWKWKENLEIGEVQVLEVSLGRRI